MANGDCKIPEYWVKHVRQAVRDGHCDVTVPVPNPDAKDGTMKAEIELKDRCIDMTVLDYSFERLRDRPPPAGPNSYWIRPGFGVMGQGYQWRGMEEDMTEWAVDRSAKYLAAAYTHLVQRHGAQ